VKSSLSRFRALRTLNCVI